MVVIACTQDPTKQCLNPETCRAGIPCHPVTRQWVCEPAVVGMRQTDRNDPEPKPEEYDGPGLYTADHAAWAARQPQPLTPKEVLARDLNQWWMDTAHEEAVAVVDKAVEYGANSMTELGHEIAKLAGRQITDRQAIELACYFYIKGKMGRWSDSIIAGRPVSDDTLGDIGVYVRMAQRVRSHGGWPGVPNDYKEQGA